MTFLGAILKKVNLFGCSPKLLLYLIDKGLLGIMQPELRKRGTGPKNTFLYLLPHGIPEFLISSPHEPMNLRLQQE